VIEVGDSEDEVEEVTARPERGTKRRRSGHHVGSIPTSEDDGGRRKGKRREVERSNPGPRAGEVIVIED